MTTFGDDFITSLDQTLDHAKGRKESVREHIIHMPDVRAICEKLGLSQAEFAKIYQIPLATLKGWEQGRRQPDQTASAYLSVIAAMPAATRDALAT
jgi:putative transcriptional regulator